MQEEAVRINSTNVDSIVEKMEKAKDLTLHKRQMRFLVRYLVKNENERAYTWLKIGQDLMHQIDDKEYEISMLYSEAYLYMTKESMDKSIPVWNRALQLAREINDDHGVGSIISALGYIESSKNNFELAYKYQKEAISYADKSGALEMVNNYKSVLMGTCSDLNKTEEAIALGNEVIKDSLKKETELNHTNLRNVYHTLSENLFKMGEVEKSLQAAKESKKYAKLCKMPRTIGIATLQVAQLLVEMNNFDEAQRELEIANDIFTEIPSVRYFGYLVAIRAELLIKTNRQAEALALMKQLDVNRLIEKHEHQLVSTVYLQMAKASLDLKNFKETEQYLNKLETFLSQDSDETKWIQTYELYVNLYEVNQKFEKALEFHKKFHALKSKVSSKDRNRVLAEMEAKFELAKKQQESDKHKLEKMEFQQMALRAQMNPHFIFNALNSIHDQILHHNKKSAAHHLTRFSELMRTILENSESASLSIEKEVEFLTKYLRIEQLRFGHNFTFEIRMDTEIEEDVMKIPTMVIQPYVENAIIHGVRKVKEGRIEIGFSLLNDDTIQCIITDNGKGINASKNHTTKKHKSMSTKISRTRLENLSKQFKRKMSVKTFDCSNEPKSLIGTKVLVTLPIL